MSDMRQRGQAQSSRAVRPLGTVIEREGTILLRLDMPGVRREDLDIQVEDYQLTILGKRAFAAREGAYVLRERWDGDFRSAYTIDDSIDPRRIDAALENGVLTVTLHLKEEVKPKKIAIKTG